MKTFFVTLLLCPLLAMAAYTVKDGKLLHVDEVATVSVQEHYSAALKAQEHKEWEELLKQSTILLKNFGTTPFALEANFLRAVAHFNRGDFDLANHDLSSYLKRDTTPKHFEEALSLKLAIAENFHNGAKKHLFNVQVLPKWVPAREEALALYDEVIAALPHHELSAKALYGKAQLLSVDEEYKGGIEAYQALIRRFPKHPLAIESYLGIAEVYAEQCKTHFSDPAYLELAEINLRKFKADFPAEQRLAKAEKIFRQMQETYAKELFDTASFFERTRKPQAARLYYMKVLSLYPSTKSAERARKRLEEIAPPKTSPSENEEATPSPTPARLEESVLPEATSLTVMADEKKA